MSCFRGLISLTISFLIVLSITNQVNANDKINGLPKIVAGYYHSLAIKGDGTLWTWGNGSSDSTENLSPVQMGTANDWAQITAGNLYSLAIKNNGTLWAWGNNNEGQLGDGTFVNKQTPSRIDANTNWQKTASGFAHNLALKTDGTLWSWGRNTYGQLGIGIGPASSVPVQVGENDEWVEIAAGNNHSLAIKKDGTLWAWGHNEDGELGINYPYNVSYPKQVGNDSDWIQVVAGFHHTLALKIDGTLWGWGNNKYGALGDLPSTSLTYKVQPTQIGDDNDWLRIEAGRFHSWLFKKDGSLWGFGTSRSGAFGIESPDTLGVPTQLSVANEWIRASGGDYYSLLLKDDGTLWSCGSDQMGRLGLGDSFFEQYVPAKIMSIGLPSIKSTYDFNADGTSDILFQHSDDGRLLIWTIDNFARTVKFPQSLASSWDVVDKGDFNGDGTADVLYMKTDGTTAIAEMTNAARSNLTFPGGINPVWTVNGVGDFNGDGTQDILWRRSTDGVTMVWGIVNSTRNKVSWPGGLASFWDVVGIGDFDADGTDDILCQHNTDGRLLIWKMDNHGRASVKLPKSLANTWTVVGVGDFNADGTDDVLYRKDTGDTAIAEFSNLNRSAIKFPGGIGLPWSVKDVGDYNGDGTDDIFFRRSTDGVTLAWGIVNSARSKVAWPGGLAKSWVVQGSSKILIDPLTVDNDGDGVSENQGDCDDSNPAINPGAQEIRNTIDDNCNGQIDEGFPAAGFADANLQACVDATGLPYDQITSLDCSGKNISSLSGIEQLSNLQYFHVYENQITDVYPIRGMTSLLFLAINYNQITNITPLENLSDLQYLSVDNNCIVDLSPTSNLPNLTTLITGTQRSDCPATPTIHIAAGAGTYSPESVSLLMVDNNSDGTAHITSESLATIYDLVIKDAEGNPLPDVSVNYYESGGKSVFHLVDKSKTYADVFVTGSPENLLTVYGNPSVQTSPRSLLPGAHLVFSMTVLYYEQYKFTVNAYTAAKIYDDSYAPNTCQLNTSQPYESFCMTAEQIAELVKARYGMGRALSNIAFSFLSAGIPVGEAVSFAVDASVTFLGGIGDYLIEELMEKAVLSRFEATNRKYLVRVFTTEGQEFGDNAIADLFTRFDIDIGCTECNEGFDPPYVSPPPQVWFKDNDLDGYGDADSTPVVGESGPSSYYLIEELISPDTDCNDDNTPIHPTADEICDDGIDQDCNSSDLACFYERYIDNGDGTIYDKQAGLTWQQGITSNISGYIANGVYHSLYNPDRLHQGCADLNLGSFTSWRVPTRSELKSLVDHNYYPKINPLFKTITGTYPEYWQRYWTSEINNDPSSFYIVDFDTGTTKFASSGFEERLRCVVGENWYLDNDLDGYSEGTFVTGTYPPTDRYFSSESLHAINGDCNDFNSTIHPTAPETCGDGIDQDCDGVIDEDCVAAPPAPTGIVLENLNCGGADGVTYPGVKIYWDLIPEANQYSVWRSTSLNGSYDYIGSDSSGVNYFWDNGCDSNGMSFGTTYYYKMKAASSDTGLISPFSDAVSITLPPSNSAPVADAGSAQVVRPGATVTLDGSASYDPDNDVISTYSWTVLAKPQGSSVSLDGINSPQPTFVPDYTGDYIIGLVVNDGQENSLPETVTITVTTDRFFDNGDGTVSDLDTGLVWLKDAGCLGAGDYNMSVWLVERLADGQCSLTDSSVAGDWRIPYDSFGRTTDPLANEWTQFLDTRFASPALSNATGDAQWSDGDVFLNVLPEGRYWSSYTTATYGYRVYMATSGGSGTEWPFIYSSYTWPVRDAK